MIRNGGWIWFSGILLPAGFKDLKYNSFYPFKLIEKYLYEFKDQPIKLEFHTIIGKIKYVWKDNEGRLIVGGYIRDNIKYEGIAISFMIEGNVHCLKDFGCSIVKEPYYPECVILERKKINLFE